jgi:hypothetical protein
MHQASTFRIAGESIEVSMNARSRKGLIRGISRQEAPQAHGEEKASQAAAQDEGSTPQ